MNNKIFTLVSFVLLSVSVFSQSQDTLRFSFMEAVKYAVKNNPQLEATKLNEESNRYKIKEIKASALPQITGSGNGTDNFQRATQLLPGEMLGQPGKNIPVQFGTEYVYGSTVQLNQALFSPSLSIGIKAAKESQGYYELQTFKTKEELIYSVINVCVQMQMLEKQQDLITGNIDRMKKLLEITTVQYNEGIIKKVDLEQLKVNYTNLQTQQYSTNISINQLLNNLKILMNIDVDQPMVIKAEVNTYSVEPISQQLFLEANTDLNILDKQIQLQKLNTRNIKASYLPTVSFSANYGRQWQTNELFKSSLTSGFSSGYYAVNVSIPIFDGLSKRNKIKQSDVSLKQLNLNKEYLIKNVQNQFKTAKDNLTQNQNILHAQDQNMKVAEELYNVAKLSYTEGISSLSELINAENGLREAQVQYLTAMLQINLAEVETMKASGQLSQLIKAEVPNK